MKQLIYVLGLVLGGGEVLAQPGIEWQKSFGGSENEDSKSVQQTSDGGYIMAGYALSNNGEVSGNHGGYDLWVVKLNNAGSIHWKKAYGGSDSEWIFAMIQTTDGGYIIAGYTLSNNGDVSGNHGAKDYWVIKLTYTGAIQWQKALGGSYEDEAWAIQQTADGGYIIAGRSNSKDGDVTVNNGAFDFWVVKLNGLGNLEWQKSLGGSGDDMAYAIKQTPEGGYIVVGESGSTDGDTQGNHGSADYWVVKLSALGQIEWQKMFGSTSIDRPNDVVITSDGGYLVVGNGSGNNGDVIGNHGGFDFWAVKLDSQGNLQWQKCIGGSDQDYAQSVQQTIDSGYVIAGSTVSTDGDVVGNDGAVEFWVVKISMEGEIQWQQTYGGTKADRAFCIKQTSDEGYIVAGRSSSSDGDATINHGGTDYWVVKLSPESTPTSTPSTQALTLSPNPAQNTLTIQTPEPGKLDFQIHNLLGQALWHQSLVESDLGLAQVDISLLPRGLYLVSVTGASGRVYVGRFLKGE